MFGIILNYGVMMSRPPVDITGQRFDTLVALFPISNSDKGELIWECECDCGNITYSTSSDLKRGRTNICSICVDKKSRLSPVKGLYGNYRRGAEERNLNFNIDLETFETIIFKDCNYCLSPPMQTYKKEQAKCGIVYNGIDRKNNSIGYEIENVVPCCKFCNFAKSNSSVEEFGAWINRLINSKK
jgi:hypothetical protein